MMAGSEHTDNALHSQLSTDPHSSVERQRGGGEETEIKAFVLVQFVRRRKRNAQTPNFLLILSPISLLRVSFMCG